MEYRTRNGQTIFDLTINTIQDYNGIYGLILSNPVLTNIESVPPIEVIEFTEPKITPPTVQSQQPKIEQTFQNYYSRNNQTVYDVVMQTYNDLNRTYELIEDSFFNNIQTYPVVNTLFKFNPKLIEDKSFSNYLSKNGLVINTKTAYGVIGALQTDDGVDITTDDGITITID